MNFGEAVQALKENKKVERMGWNGKGMYLMYIPANGWARLFGDTSSIDNSPFIAMKTVDNKMVPWLASQTDILAEDWQLTL